MTNKIKLTVLVLLTFSIINVKAQDGASVLKKIDEVMYSAKDISSNLKIILTDTAGKEETREAELQQKGSDMRLFRFTSPSSQAGIAFLSLPDDIMYLYLPAFGKERRIATSAKNQSFSGTDFSYEDMESRPFAEKYTATLTKTETSSYTLELKPIATSDYSKVIVKVNKTNYYPESTEYYDISGTKVKTGKYTFAKVGSYWNASEIEMTDLKKNHKTKLQSSDVKYDTGLTDDDFTIQTLKE